MLRTIGCTTPLDQHVARARTDQGREDVGKATIFPPVTADDASLLDLLYLARMSNDSEGMAEVNEKINKFNEVVPGAFRITEDTKARSYRQHVQRGRDSINGVYINKNVRDYIEENYGD